LDRVVRTAYLIQGRVEADNAIHRNTDLVVEKFEQDLIDARLVLSE